MSASATHGGRKELQFSLYVMLMATVRQIKKTAKVIKRCYYPSSHRLNVKYYRLFMIVAVFYLSPLALRRSINCSFMSMLVREFCKDRYRYRLTFFRLKAD